MAQDRERERLDEEGYPRRFTTTHSSSPPPGLCTISEFIERLLCARVWSKCLGYMNACVCRGVTPGDCILVGAWKMCNRVCYIVCQKPRAGHRQAREVAKRRIVGGCSSSKGLQDKSAVDKALVFLWLRGDAGAGMGILEKGPGEHTCLALEGKWGLQEPSAEVRPESVPQAGPSFRDEQCRPRAGVQNCWPLLGPAVLSLMPAAHWLFLLWNVPAPGILLGNRGSSYPLSLLSSPPVSGCIWGCLGSSG